MGVVINQGGLRALAGARRDLTIKIELFTNPICLRLQRTSTSDKPRQGQRLPIAIHSREANDSLDPEPAAERRLFDFPHTIGARLRGARLHGDLDGVGTYSFLAG